MEHQRNYVREQTVTKLGATVRSLFGREGRERPMVTNTTKNEASVALALNVKTFMDEGGIKRIITREETYDKASPQLKELLK